MTLNNEFLISYIHVSNYLAQHVPAMKSIVNTVLIFGFCIYSANTSAQGNPQGFLRELFRTLEVKDSIAYLKANLSIDDLQNIFPGDSNIVEFNLSKDSLNKAIREEYEFHICSVDFRHHLQGLEDLAGKNGIFQFLDLKYKIEKSPQIQFPSLKATIYFKSSNNYFRWDIQEAVFLHDQWKLAASGAMNVVYDTSIFRQDKKMISAFGTFGSATDKVTTFTIGDTTFQEVTIIVEEEVDDLPPPPPPPPPPPKGVIKKKKK